MARKLTSAETTHYLLETLLMAREVMAEAGDGTGSGTPRMSKLWHQGSYKRLEEALERMPAVRPVQFAHVRGRYLQAVDKVIDARIVRLRNKQFRVVLPPYTVQRGAPAVKAGHSIARVAVRQYDPWVRLEKVRRGVDWLASELDRTGGCQLPVELWETLAA